MEKQGEQATALLVMQPFWYIFHLGFLCLILFGVWLLHSVCRLDSGPPVSTSQSTELWMRGCTARGIEAADGRKGTVDLQVGRFPWVVILVSPIWWPRPYKVTEGEPEDGSRSAVRGWRRGHMPRNVGALWTSDFQWVCHGTLLCPKTVAT